MWRVSRRWVFVAVAAALAALAVAILVASSAGARAPDNLSRMPAADIVHDVLRGNGIGAVRFGAPPHAV
jgi:hypothetical protein